jgi:ribose transport system substrate-binding protein
MTRLRRVAPIAVAALACIAAALITGCGSSSSESEKAEPKVSHAVGYGTDFRGPYGEKSVPGSTIKFTPADLKKLREGHYEVALVFAGLDPVLPCLRARLKQLHLAVGAQALANFDANKQKNDIETVLAKKPDAIISLIVDENSAAAAFRPAVEQKIPLIFEENVPTGYHAGDGYYTDVAQDYNWAAKGAAEIIAKSMGESGKLGVVYYAANFFVTNQYDHAFEKTIEDRYPKIEMDKAGFSNPEKAQEVAAGLIARNPDLKGVYGSWQETLAGVVAALRAAHANDVTATGIGIDETIALNIAERGPVVGIGGPASCEEGELEAEMAAYALLGKKAPPLVISRAFAVTRSNLRAGWKASYNTPLPAPVAAALAE